MFVPVVQYVYPNKVATTTHNNKKYFRILVTQMAQAFGGLQEVAKLANLHPTDLDIYRDRISPSQDNPGR